MMMTMTITAQNTHVDPHANTTTETIITVEGWFALHDFRTIDWQGWLSQNSDEKLHAQASLDVLTQRWQNIDEKREGSFGTYHVVGQKADLLFLHLRPTLNELAELQRELNTAPIARFLKPAHSYVSVVELSNYVVQHAGSVDHPEVQARLKPKLPKSNHVCFYPMNKRRGAGEGNNWYTLQNAERARMMRAHGETGRRFKGRVVQIISGSMGFDDWEWGVTLFANDPIDIKKLVQEMRFDEVSARFAEFGPFLIGCRANPSELMRF
jgi:chlorite dismutase